MTAHPAHTVRVLHALRADSRRTTIDHAACFARTPSDQAVVIEYVNAFGPVGSLDQVSLLIVTYDLLALRVAPYWPYLRRIIERARASADRVVYFPQDDYTMCGELDDLYSSTEADFVFSPIRRDLDVLYPRTVRSSTKIREALTGYVAGELVARAPALERDFGTRDIDVGQRIRLLPPIFGEEARAKGRLALDFGHLAAAAGFITDVSTDPNDILSGDEWLSFLGNTRFTVGRMGGASVCDPLGRHADRFRRMKARRPSMTEEEVSSRISWRGTRRGDFSAISPRIFEAAALGVCQVLVSNAYLDGLTPGEHFIPLESDMTNVDAVLSAMRDTSRSAEIARSAREFLVGSERFSYSSFVGGFWSEVLPDTGRSDRIAERPRIADPAAQLVPLLSQDGELRDAAVAAVREAVRLRHRGVYPTRRLASAGGLAVCDPRMIDACNAWLDHVRDGSALLEGLVVPWVPVSVAAVDVLVTAG